MEKCTFLIVTPVLNCERFIADCIKSVRCAFDGFGYKHVIVDGGSTDNTQKIIKGENHANLFLLNSPDTTMYQAINEGLNYVEADYFYQLNADDMILPDTPKIVYERFQKEPELAVVSGICLTINIDDNHCKFLVPTRNHFRLDKIGVNLFISQPSSFVRYAVMKDVGGYCEKYEISADNELWLSLISKGYKFGRIASCLSVDRLHNKCKRCAPRCMDELYSIRRDYFKSRSLFHLLKLRNAIDYMLMQLIIAVRMRNILQNGTQVFGNVFTRLFAVFFSTKKAGINLDYPFFKGSYNFKGRVW